ncbi:Coronin-like protein crn1 [Tulasnella sp. 330]|nr:Coronin-like protein crn1 [Tulasnella sp. 330]KAG8882429.1 Coronin-like protein crn1 [Tulasnella sp. 332]
MSRFVRASKYRHVFGQAAKKEHGLENVRISSSAWDTNLCGASGQYISVNYQVGGGGAFAILPLPGTELSAGVPYRLPDVFPLARGHTAPVLDTDWSPFDDRIVASGGEDGKVLVWKVEGTEFEGWGAEKWVPQDFEPVSRIAASARKIGQVMFHPTASHVLASATGDHTVKLWDLANAEDPRSTLVGHGDTIQSIAFNSTGTLLATTSRDRKLRLFDPRTGGEAVRVGEGHGGIKGARIAWMGDMDKIATTGFSRMSDRQVSIWDTGSLDSEKTINIDQSAGVLMPFWSDNGILFLAGKGDGNIRCYEYDQDSLFALSDYTSPNPQRGMCFLPRRALNVSECEIARAYKVYGTSVEPISFIVPRKSDSFQADIFPPAPSSEPALSASEFFSGKTAPRNLVDLDSGTASTGAAPTTLHHQPTPTKSATAPATLSAFAPEPVIIHKSPAIAEPPSTPAATTTTTHDIQPQPQPPSPTTQHSPPIPSFSVTDSSSSDLKSENEKLAKELREANALVRNLELQVETLKANANKARQLLG